MSTYLHDIKSLPDLIKEWDKLDKGGTDLAAIRTLCKVDLYYLLVRACNRPDALHPWIYARCREFEANPDGFIDIWAREHYKSTIITFAKTIQDILNDPEITVGIFSHSGSVAAKFLIQIKNELERNDVLKAAFPDILYKDPQGEGAQWTQSQITVKRKGNPKESTVECSGLVDSMPVGRHYKLLIYDDVVVPASVNTPEQIEKTTEAYELSLSLGSEGDRRRIIGTRYSFADTYDSIIKKGMMKVRIHAASDDGTPDGKPVLMAVKSWERKKLEVSPSILACQYLCDPLSGTQRMFDTGDLEVYEIRPHSVNIYIMVDPARSMSQGSDNTAIAVFAVDTNLNKYLVDGINHRCDLQDRWRWTELLYKKWVRQPGVQSVHVGYEKYGAIADLDYFKEQMKLPGAAKFSIVELAWVAGGRGEQSKTSRVQRLGPDLRQHKIFIPYKTDEKRLTKLQISMKDQGMEHRIAKPIRKMDSEQKSYDVTEQFVTQLNYFPVGKKDFVDAASRIYDMSVKSPYNSNENDTLLMDPAW